jgi:hypothetical protein
MPEDERILLLRLGLGFKESIACVIPDVDFRSVELPDGLVNQEKD